MACARGGIGRVASHDSIHIRLPLVGVGDDTHRGGAVRPADARALAYRLVGQALACKDTSISAEEAKLILCELAEVADLVLAELKHEATPAPPAR